MNTAIQQYLLFQQKNKKAQCDICPRLNVPLRDKGFVPRNGYKNGWDVLILGKTKHATLSQHVRWTTAWWLIKAISCFSTFVYRATSHGCPCPEERESVWPSPRRETRGLPPSRAAAKVFTQPDTWFSNKQLFTKTISLSQPVHLFFLVLTL